MSTFIAWAPLAIILGAVLYTGWVYIQYLYQLEQTRLFVNITWTDNNCTRVEVQSLLEAQEFINRLTWSWVKDANVTKGSFIIGELNKLGQFTWLE